MKDSERQTVAAWMWETIQAEGELDFRRTAERVQDRFGPAFLEPNRFGRHAVRGEVRDLFMALHGGSVARGGSRWYLRSRSAEEARDTRAVFQSPRRW